MLNHIRESAIPAATRQRGFGLTAPQIPIWIDQSLHPQKPIYNTGQILTLRTALDIDRFIAALNKVIAETDGLRLRFFQCDDEILQEVMAEVSTDLEYSDFSSERSPEAAATAWFEQLFWTPLAAIDFPLFRFALAKVAEDHFLWLQNYHHLIIDATGRQLVAARVAAIYDALSAKAEPPDLPFTTYVNLADVDGQYLASASWTADENYWRTRLLDLPAPLVQSDPRLSEKSRSGHPTRLACDVSRETSDALRAFARQQGSSVFKVILGLTWCTFSRLYGNSDLIFGVPVSNRRGREASRTVGLFVKIVPFRARLDPTMTFAAALSALGSNLSNDLKHQRFPSHRLNRLLRSQQYAAGDLYGVIVNYQRNDYTFSFGGAAVSCSNISVAFSVPWEITAFEYGPDAAIQIVVDYDPGRVGSDEAARFLRCFQELLRRAPDCAGIAAGRMPMVPVEESAALIRRGQGKRVATPDDLTLATLLAEQVTRQPEATALICGNQRLSYTELHARADQLARRLAGLGVGPDTLVGISLPRTSVLVVAILAVHKAGGAYLPLDLSYPHERLTFMVDDSKVKMILTQRAHAAMLAGTGARLILIDESSSEYTNQHSIFEPGNRVGPGNLAYVIYTSGSTGKPKGVAVTHGSAVNLVLSSRGLISDEDVSGVLFATSLNFDISVYELFMPLAFGGAIILVDNLFALETAPARDKVSLVNTVPSLLNAFLTRASVPIGVRLVNLIGETLPRALADRIFADRPEIRLFNLYGPTETTVYSTWSAVEPSDRRPPPIGVPTWNTDVYVLDESLELVPDGAIGELWIGGAGVAHGYLNRPELTEQRFIPNPFGDGRIYKTGDLVRWLPDGQLGFFGRADHQVKINGVRIELGEIEECLRAHAAIAEAVVTPSKHESHRKSLVAYLLSRPGVARPDDSAVRRHLAAALPLHFIPATLVWLNAFPLSPNGKIDRKALLDAKALTTVSAYSAGGRPRDEIETAVLKIWRKFFKGKTIGVDEDYFELGGDSLNAFWLIGQCNKSFGTDLPLSLLFTHSTVESLAVAIRTAVAGESCGPPQGHRNGSPKVPLVVVMPGMGGDDLTLARFRASFNDAVDFVVIEYPSWRDMIDGRARLEVLVESAIAQIRAACGDEICLLVGYSFGGFIACEVAYRLLTSGHPVGFLGIIDTLAPEQRETHQRRETHQSLVERYLQRWKMHQGLIGRIHMVAAVLLRVRAFSLLRAYCWGVMSLMPSRWVPAFHQVLINHLSRVVLREWVGKPVQVPTMLFRSGEHVQGVPDDYGWRAVCEQLTIIPIGGSHQSILEPPWSEVLRDRLLEALRSNVIYPSPP